MNQRQLSKVLAICEELLEELEKCYYSRLTDELKEQLIYNTVEAFETYLKMFKTIPQTRAYLEDAAYNDIWTKFFTDLTLERGAFHWILRFYFYEFYFDYTVEEYLSFGEVVKKYKVTYFALKSFDPNETLITLTTACRFVKSKLETNVLPRFHHLLQKIQ